MKVERYGNLTGLSGTKRTIRMMRRLVDEGRSDPTILYLAEQLARKRGPKDFRGQSSILHDWVQKHIHYTKDPRATELLRSPIWTLYYRAGDCDDQAILLCALAEAIGFKTRFKTIKADQNFPAEFSHVYSQIQLPDTGEWITSDTIVPRAQLGWESDQQIGSRTWEGNSMSIFGLGAEEVAEPQQPQSMWAAFKQNVGGSFASAAANAFQKVSSNAVSRWFKEQPAAASGQVSIRPPSGVPSWLLPVGAVAAGIATLILVKRRKRR